MRASYCLLFSAECYCRFHYAFHTFILFIHVYFMIIDCVDYVIIFNTNDILIILVHFIAFAAEKLSSNKRKINDA